MERALAVVDDTERSRDLLRHADEAGLLRTASEFAAASGASLVVLTLMSAASYERELAALGELAAAEFRDGEPAQVYADALAAAELVDVPVEYEAVGLVAGDDPAEQVVSVAESRGCDHVFVAGRQRSPTGKAVFGDTAQAVALRFGGPVTVVTD